MMSIFECKKIIFLLFLITSPLVSAEPLELQIFQKGLGDPVVGATVVVKQEDIYQVTNNRGFLKFDNLQFPVDLKILAQGYVTLEQKVDKPKTSIYIEPISFDLNALVVTEDRVKEKLSKIVLQQEELHSVAGTQGDPIKMIDTLPGIIKNDNGNFGTRDFNSNLVRGSSGAENSIIMQRLPVDYLYHIWGISIVNPGLVDNFNVFLGGFPVEYDDVLGGVIDIKLRKPKADRLHQTYRIALNESSALIEGPLNKQQSFFVAARASYIDRALQPVIEKINKASEEDSEDFRIITLPRYWDAQANWHINLPKGELDLLYFGSNDQLKLDLNEADGLDPDIIGRINYNIGFHSVGINATQRISSNVSGILTTSFKKGQLGFTLGNDESGEPFGYNANSYETFIHPQLLWQPKWKIGLSRVKHEIMLGNNLEYGKYIGNLNIDLLETEGENGGDNFSSLQKFKTNVDMRIIESASYAKWRLTKGKLSTTVGLRYSKVRGTNGINMSGLSPRLLMEYQHTKKLLFTGTWGKYIQMPDWAQLIKGYGNPRLNFTKVEHRIAGFQYQINPLWSVQTEVYYKPMTNLVLSRRREDPPNTYRNDGRGRAYGLDVLIKRNYGNRKMGWLSYSFANSTRTIIDGTRRRFSGDQPHSISLVWRQPFMGSWTKWSWGVKLQASSGQPYTPVVGRIAKCNTSDGNIEVCPNQFVAETNEDLAYWTPIYAKQNILRRPFAHKMDLRIDRLIRYNTWTMKIYLDIINVTFQRSGLSEVYGQTYQNYRNPVQLSTFPSIPLPFVGVEATF